MADLHDGLDVGDPAPETGEAGNERVAWLFRARYPEMVRLADLLGADDPEDIAQEAFARLIRKYGRLASITLSNYFGASTGPLVLQELAVNRVVSVTAVRPVGLHVDVRSLAGQRPAAVGDPPAR